MSITNREKLATTIRNGVEIVNQEEGNDFIFSAEGDTLRLEGPKFVPPHVLEGFTELANKLGFTVTVEENEDSDTLVFSE